MSGSGFFSVYQELESDHNSSWQPASPEEIANIKAIREEKKATCVHLSLSELPKAYWGFLGSKASGVLGGHPDPAYVSALEKQLPEQGDLTGLSLA